LTKEARIYDGKDSGVEKVGQPDENL